MLQLNVLYLLKVNSNTIDLLNTLLVILSRLTPCHKYHFVHDLNGVQKLEHLQTGFDSTSQISDKSGIWISSVV